MDTAGPSLASARRAVERSRAARRAAPETYEHWVSAHGKALEGLYGTLLYQLRLEGVATRRPIEYGAFCRFAYDHSSGKVLYGEAGLP